MPIYPYLCASCGHAFDALQKISDQPFTECPECGESALRKQLTAASFRLKGSGWYETDFKNKPKSDQDKDGAKPADDKADNKEGKKADNKADNKEGKKADGKGKDEKKTAANDSTSKSTGKSTSKSTSTSNKSAT